MYECQKYKWDCPIHGREGEVGHGDDFDGASCDGNVFGVVVGLEGARRLGRQGDERDEGGRGQWQIRSWSRIGYVGTLVAHSQHSSNPHLIMPWRREKGSELVFESLIAWAEKRLQAN